MASGPIGHPAGFPNLRLNRTTGAELGAHQNTMDCNWLKCFENIIDPVLTAFLHAMGEKAPFLQYSTR